MNIKLVTTLDKCKMTDHDGVWIVIATAETLQHNLKDLIINRSSIQWFRYRLHEEP